MCTSQNPAKGVKTTGYTIIITHQRYTISIYFIYAQHLNGALFTTQCALMSSIHTALLLKGVL